jgi:hypothetical protein
MFIACYEELLEKMPGAPTALILGDAYMSIQEVRSGASRIQLIVLESTFW